MTHATIYTALEARDWQKLAEAMTARDNTDNPHIRLRLALCELSVAETKRLASDAEGWLTDGGGKHKGADFTWQCVSQVYRECIFMLRDFGVSTGLGGDCA